MSLKSNKPVSVLRNLQYVDIIVNDWFKLCLTGITYVKQAKINYQLAMMAQLCNNGAIIIKS